MYIYYKHFISVMQKVYIMVLGVLHLIYSDLNFVIIYQYGYKIK